MELTHATSTVVERLAAWICDVRYEDIPERVLEKARAQLVNVIASLHAGARTDAGRAVLAVARSRGGPAEHTVIPTGERLAMRDALLANAAFAMALDYDDYLYMGHTGHSAVLASLAIAEREGLSTRDMLVAIVVANEIGGRIGASCVLGPQNGQAWSFIHLAEGAAACAKLLGLTREQTAHALAIALYQPTFTLWPGFMGPTSKVLTAAVPTLTGIEAAELAKAGLTGALAIVEHPRKGFWASFTYVPLPAMMGGLGEAWVTDTLAFKRYPGCAYIDTTMDALFMALADARQALGRPLEEGDVASIRVEASLLTVEMDNLSSEHVNPHEPLSPVNVNFSIPYNVAIGILAGRHTGRELDQGFLDRNDRAIRGLAAKTTLVHDWSMSALVVQAFGSLGRASPIAALGPRELVRVIAGYRSQMGGAKKSSLGVGRLLGADGVGLAGRIARAVKARARGPSSSDLGGADFSRFQMAFPARITLTTRTGACFRARQDVPEGAPGQARYLEVVEEKLRTEAGEALGEPGVARALSAMRSVEDVTVSELVAQACWGLAAPPAR